MSYIRDDDVFLVSLSLPELHCFGGRCTYMSFQGHMAGSAQKYAFFPNLKWFPHPFHSPDGRSGCLEPLGLGPEEGGFEFPPRLPRFPLPPRPPLPLPFDLTALTSGTGYDRPGCVSFSDDTDTGAAATPDTCALTAATEAVDLLVAKMSSASFSSSC